MIKKELLAAAILSISFFNCARQTTPEGGPKDTTKPELTKSVPENNQKNFKQKKIELYFTEDVKLKDPKEEILITPSPGKEIKYEAIGDKVTIEPKEGWKDSVTYNIQLRESIQDITENNPSEDIHLAFSTGRTIDSLSISGSVKNARKETIPERITVAIYNQDTFNIFKNTPSYFTKSDKEGNFRINNLKQGTYFIYAFDDKNKNLKVESTSEKYGFRSKPVKLIKNYDSADIALVNIDSRPIKLNSIRSNNKTTLIRFNKNLTYYKTTFEKTSLLNTYGENKTEIMFYYKEPEQVKDSLRVRVTATDSLNQKFDSLLYIKPGDSKAVKTTFSISTEPIQYNYKTGTVELKGKTNIPLSKITTDSIYLKLDSISKIALQTPTFSIDSLSKKFTLTAKIDTIELSTTKKPEKGNLKKPLDKKKINPQLILAKTLFVSIYNDSSKYQTINIPKKETSKTGSLSIKIETQSKNYGIELLNSSNEIIQTFTNKTECTFTELNGEYKVRAFHDINGNGKWDTANILTRTEPEPTYYYKGIDNKFTIPVRENFDVGPFKFKF